MWPDRIRIVLGWPWGWNIPLDGIEEIKPARGLAAMVSWGVRFATSVKTTVRIRRIRGMDIIISPDDPAEFIASVRRAQGPR